MPHTQPGQPRDTPFPNARKTGIWTGTAPPPGEVLLVLPGDHPGVLVDSDHVEEDRHQPLQVVELDHMAVADASASLIITGNGDVLEPEQGIVAIGSGGAYAHSAAKALLVNTELSAQEIVKKSLEIAGELCIYTNMNHTIETL